MTDPTYEASYRAGLRDALRNVPPRSSLDPKAKQEVIEALKALEGIKKKLLELVK